MGGQGLEPSVADLTGVADDGEAGAPALPHPQRPCAHLDGVGPERRGDPITGAARACQASHGFQRHQGGHDMVRSIGGRWARRWLRAMRNRDDIVVARSARRGSDGSAPWGPEPESGTPWRRIHRGWPASPQPLPAPRWLRWLGATAVRPRRQLPGGVGQPALHGATDRLERPTRPGSGHGLGRPLRARGVADPVRALLTQRCSARGRRTQRAPGSARRLGQRVRPTGKPGHQGFLFARRAQREGDRTGTTDDGQPVGAEVDDPVFAHPGKGKAQRGRDRTDVGGNQGWRVGMPSGQGPNGDRHCWWRQAACTQRSAATPSKRPRASSDPSAPRGMATTPKTGRGTRCRVAA